MCKRRVARFVLGKIQIQINECSHQIGFPSTHWQAEKIICIVYAIKYLFENSFAINAGIMLLNNFLQFGCNLIPVLVFQ